MIVLDTSVLSAAFRRKAKRGLEKKTAEKLRNLVRDDVHLAIPGVVFQELLSGVRDERAFVNLQEALAGFGKLLADEETHVLAASIANTCRAAGVATSSFDCLIAAHAIENEGSLFTNDKDFARIAKHTKLALLSA
jgi:predicted nucleic acid-binding protein